MTLLFPFSVTGPSARTPRFVAVMAPAPASVTVPPGTTIRTVPLVVTALFTATFPVAPPSRVTLPLPVVVAPPTVSVPDCVPR